MSKAERERRHQDALERINQAQVVVGLGDRARVDHEGTLLARARMMMEEISSHQATERGLAALDRLLRIADDRHSPCREDVRRFITSVWSSQPLPLACLRGLDPGTGDDMLAVLDAFRHARLDLAEHVRGGPHRVARVMSRGTLAGV